MKDYVLYIGQTEVYRGPIDEIGRYLSLDLVYTDVSEITLLRVVPSDISWDHMEEKDRAYADSKIPYSDRKQLGITLKAQQRAQPQEAKYEDYFGFDEDGEDEL